MADNKKLLFLSNTKESLEYASPSSFANKIYPKRENPSAHADFITRKMLECRIQSTHQTQALTQEQVAAIHYKDGMYLEFSGAQNYDLATKSLEHFASGIRLLNVKKEENITKATVYVPNGKEKVFLNKVEAYAQSSLTGDKIKNDNLISSIENIRLAILESFWIGDIDSIPKEDISAWCEVWLRCDTGAIDGVVSNFFEWCKSFEILFKTDKIVFPERLVVIVYANQLQLKKLISACEYIAEIRRAPEIATFFDELTFSEQKEWCDDLVYRTDFTDSNTTVCVLDTGINKEHPLIEPYTDSQYVQAVDASWNILDKNGHGTAMAGVALYRNLQESLESSEKIQISHKLESIKILPDNSANTPQLYGAITKQAVALAEIANPRANRVICMAVTSDVYNTNDGSPTSWSAAVDSLISGDEEGGQKRLFFVSAGNVDTSELQDRGFYEANILHNVESPGQAWNAITVGGYNNNIKIKDPSFNGYSPVSDVGDLSPFSSTSLTWDKKWPIKPEILLNSGNAATNSADYTDCPDLSLLSTFHDINKHLFTTTCGTSPATAEASWMAAQLFKEYPNMWPETVRALLIHSADWTSKMQQQFNADDKKTTGRRILLRTCGYGIPSLEKALWCKNNSVNMVIEGELQPFKKEGSDYKMKEMDLHELPWPTDVLQDLGDTEVRLRVTLSYFIEPGPGEIGWKDKYRYPSCGLRFDLINNDEDITDFKKRINVKMRGDNKKDNGEGTSGSDRWYLGSDNRDVGSIHSDFIISSGVELCNAKYIAVYPVIGWWRERPYLDKFNKKIRYSLVVSLETPRVEADLYTSIVTKIATVV